MQPTACIANPPAFSLARFGWWGLLLLGALAASRARAEDSANPTAGVPAQAPADRWPLFRGSAPMTGLAAGTLPAKLELLWTYLAKGGIKASAAIVEGVVYLPTLDGRLLALRLADGKEVWGRRLPADAQGNPSLGSEASPLVVGDKIFLGDEDCFVRAFDRATGKLLWQYETDGPIVSSANFIDGKVIVGSNDSRLLCFEPATGKLLWEHQTDDRVNCAPALLAGPGGNEVVVAGCDGYLRTIRVADGGEGRKLGLASPIAATPAIEGTFLAVGTMSSNEVIGVELRDQGQTLAVRWRYQNEKRPAPFYSSPALTRELVLVGGRDKLLHALDRATGKPRWTFATRGQVDSSPVVVGEWVFVGSDDGSLHMVELATGKEGWSYKLGRKVSASPAVAAGRLILSAEDGTVYCFGNK